MSPLMLRLFAILLIVISISTIDSAPCPGLTATQTQYDSAPINWTGLPQLLDIQDVTSRNLQYWQQLFTTAMQVMQQQLSCSTTELTVQ